MFKVAAIVSALAACASAALESVTLTHPLGSSAEVTHFGAQVLSFYPANDPKRNVFFVSKESFMDGVNSITGGVSVVFPNFGDADDFPFDGFASLCTWTLASYVEAHNNNIPSIATFTLTPNEETHQYWLIDFALELTVKLHANTLEMVLNVYNTFTEEIGINAALFNYLSVDSVFYEGLRIHNLTGLEYYDTFARENKTETRGEVVITEQTQHLYWNAPREVNIAIRNGDTPAESEANAQHPNVPAPAGKPVDRTVTIAKYGAMSGSSPKLTPTDFIVWNPWIEGAQYMKDFGDDEYQYMVAAGPGYVNDVVLIIPGDSFTLYQNITVS